MGMKLKEKREKEKEREGEREKRTDDEECINSEHHSGGLPKRRIKPVNIGSGAI
jgi:hypothetical protein